MKTGAVGVISNRTRFAPAKATQGWALRETHSFPVRMS
jgi:hypothetical protein